MSNGIEIKNLPSATTIKQNDTMTIVQDRENKQLTLDRFANESDLATFSVLENRCDEVKAKIEVDEYSAEITTSQSMSEIGSDDNGANLHENVLDGAYDSCVLKGKTKYIDNDTQEILDTFQDGRNLSLIDVKSPILSNVGKNLVNVDNYVNYPNENLPIIKDGEHSYIIENKKVGNWQNRAVDKVKLKANTTYTLSYDYELLSASVPMNYGVVINLRDDSDTSINISGDASAGKPRTFTPTRDTLARLCMYVTDTSGGINRIKFSNIQLEESSNRTEYEPYKSNILSCNGDKIELTEDMFEQGTVSGACGVGSKYGTMKENSTVRLRSKDIIKVKPNTNYRLFRENGYDGWCVAFDSNQTYLGKSYQTETFTTDSQTHYIVPVLKKTDNSTMVLSALSNFTLSEVDKTIVLRSLPDGTCDTLNVETSEYVQKIGERNYQDGDTNSNTLVTDGTKTQYKLSSPIMTKVDVQGFPHAYKNGHIQLTSGSIEPSLTPTVTYKVPVSRMGQIASNTKSNLRQSIKLDQLEILAYQSLINTEYENLLVQNSAESAASFRNLSVNDPKDGLYYMLKHLIEENQPVQNMLDKINLFYLYGLLSDEHYFDLLLGGEVDVY